MEPIFFWFKETPLGVDNRFTLDFSNTELIYQINVSTEKDIAKYYGGLLDVIKKFLTKSRLLLEKRSSISVRFIFSRISIIFSRYGKKTDKLNLFSYQEDVDISKYKFYDITDNQIEDCNIFSPYTQFQIT